MLALWTVRGNRPSRLGPSRHDIHGHPVRHGSLVRRAMGGGAVGYLGKTVPTRLLVDELLAVSGLLDAVEEALAEARVRFAEDLTSGQSARRFVAAALDEWRASDVIQLVQLLV